MRSYTLFVNGRYYAEYLMLGSLSRVADALTNEVGYYTLEIETPDGTRVEWRTYREALERHTALRFPF
jgi:hypothetical protein